MITKISWILVVFSLIISLVLPACAPSTTSPAAVKPIKIAVIGPMDSVLGKQQWWGAKIASDEINDAGGVQVGTVKRPIELIKAESNELQSIADAVTATERAITVDKADLFMGSYRSEAVLAEQEVFAEYKKIFMCSASAPEVFSRVKLNWDKYKYCFNLDAPSTQMLPFLHNYLASMTGIAKEQLGIKQVRIAILADKAIFAEAFIGMLKVLVPAGGNTIAGVWSISPSATDLSAELTAIKAADAHMIFVIMSGPASITFMKQWTDLQIPTGIIGVAAEAPSGAFWEGTTGKANYMTSFTTVARIPLNDKTIPFYDKFTKIAGMEPTQFGTTYHAGVYALADAVTRAGTVEDTEALITAMEATDLTAPLGHMVYYGRDMKAPPSAIGPEYSFPHCIVMGPSYVTPLAIQWQEGKIEAVWPWNWEGYTAPGAKIYQVPPWAKEYWKNKNK